MKNSTRLLLIPAVVVGMLVVYALFVALFSLVHMDTSHFWDGYTKGEQTIIYLLIVILITKS